VESRLAGKYRSSSATSSLTHVTVSHPGLNTRLCGEKSSPNSMTDLGNSVGNDLIIGSIKSILQNRCLRMFVLQVLTMLTGLRFIISSGL
jgi:hypothetical protein